MLTTNKTTNDTVYGLTFMKIGLSDNRIVLTGGSDLVYKIEVKAKVDTMSSPLIITMMRCNLNFTINVRLADFQALKNVIRLWDFPLSK